MVTEKPEERLEKPERTANHAPYWSMNLTLIQKLAVSVTLLVVAIFLFAGGCQVAMWSKYNGTIVRCAGKPYGAASQVGTCMDWGRTLAVTVGILLVGGVATFLLGLMSARKARIGCAEVPEKESPKLWLVALLLSIFLGGLGVDRFYLGYIELGISKLLTIGGFGIWWLIDVVMIATNSLKDAQGRRLAKK